MHIIPTGVKLPTVAILMARIGQSLRLRTEMVDSFLLHSLPNLHLDEYKSWISKYWAALTKGQGVYAQFRIYTPKKSDYYKTVATLDNSKGTQAREFRYHEEISIPSQMVLKLMLVCQLKSGVRLRQHSHLVCWPLPRGNVFTTPHTARKKSFL